MGCTCVQSNCTPWRKGCVQWVLCPVPALTPTPPPPPSLYFPSCWCRLMASAARPGLAQVKGVALLRIESALGEEHL